VNAAQIAAGLGNAHPEGGEWRCDCPVCHNHNLTVRDGSSRLLVRCFNGCTAEQVLAELRGRGFCGPTNGKAGEPHVETQDEHEANAKSAKAKQQRRIDNALDIWRHSVSADNTLAATYLASRLLLLKPIPAALRLTPAIWHKETSARYPALVGLVEHQKHGAVGIHATFLNPLDASSRLLIKPRKKTFGPIKGGAVRLAPAGRVIAVAEGIEDALTYMQATGTPSWAAISAAGIKSFVPPPLAETPTIIFLEDQDENQTGQEGVAAAAKRLAKFGYQIKIGRPTAGKDLNAALLTLGLCESLFTLTDYQPEEAGGDWYSRCLEGSDGRTLCNVTNALLALREDPAWHGVLSRDGMMATSLLTNPKPRKDS
jgi:putative DNA primase/helicase